jgi:hypothetical protein
MRWFYTQGFAVVLLVFLSATAVSASDKLPARPPQFLRVTRDAEQRPQTLETAVVRFGINEGHAPSVTVDLVAAVHIADKAYYQRLNREFARYDAVLYELVAPEGTRIPKGGRHSDNPLSMLQSGMKGMLGLEFQLDAVDYTAKNMIHADLSPQQFLKSMRDRGETPAVLFARLLAYVMAQQDAADGDAADLVGALLAGDRTRAMKQLMAGQLENMEGMVSALGGRKGSTLVEARNAAALAVLRQQMGQGRRKVAIFFGAAHMANFRERLEKDFHLVPQSTRWLVAWDMHSKAGK